MKIKDLVDLFLEYMHSIPIDVPLDTEDNFFESKKNKRKSKKSLKSRKGRR